MGERMAGRAAIVTGHDAELAAASSTALEADGAHVVAVSASGPPAGAIADVVRRFGALHALHLTGPVGAEGWATAAAAAMAATGGGAIVTTVSSRALAGDVDDRPGALADAVAGGAAVALTLALATRFGKQGVRASCVAVPPADLDPALLEASNLLGRRYRPADAAAVAAYLLSDDAAFVTGQVLRCDGGQLAHLPHYASLLAAGATTTRSGR